MFYDEKPIREVLKTLQNDKSFQKSVSNIQEGRFLRDSQTDVYNHRLIYTKALRNFVYNPAMLNVILLDENLKTLFFRTFGYRGNINFTIYPNAWLRDLPLLDFEEGVYLGDGILLGTNQVSTDRNFISVGKIKIGAYTTIDQRVSIGYSSSIGQRCAIGFDVGIGIKTKIGNHTVIGERTTIGHGNKIGSNVKLGLSSTIGNMSIIEDNVRIEVGTVIPSYSLVTKQEIINYRTKKQISKKQIQSSYA